MGVPVSSGKAPGKPMPAGVNAAVVVEVGDLVERPNPFEAGKIQKQSAVTFKNAAGEEARSYYTPSFHDRAKLAKDLKAVTGGTLPDSKTFDLQSPWPNGLLGLQCQLLIAPHVKNSKGYINAKVSAVLPAAAGQNVIPAAVVASTPQTSAPAVSNADPNSVAGIQTRAAAAVQQYQAAQAANAATVAGLPAGTIPPGVDVGF